VKNGPHALELQSRIASFVFGGVTNYDEMRRANFNPIVRLRARRFGERNGES
jgi:hypothetical protein